MPETVHDKTDDFVDEMFSPLQPSTHRDELRRVVFDEKNRELINRLEFMAAEDDRVQAPEHLLRAHSIATRRNRRRLKKRINDILGRLTERYRSLNGWVFLPNGNREWKARFSFRSQMRNQVVSLDEKTIIRHVLHTKEAYVAPFTDSDPYYMARLENTGSQMTAPICVGKGSDSERIIGIVNFESNIPGLFKAKDLKTLQNDVQELAVPLLCMETLKLGEVTCWPFNPERLGWCSHRFMKDICEEFTRSVSPPKTDLSTTVWYADYDCERLWVQATSGFDFEYESLSLSFESFTGECLKTPLTKELERSSPHIHPKYVAKDKARQMGLERILSCPIHEPDGEPQAVGAVNVYQFHEAENDYLPSDAIVRDFAKLVGEVITNHEQVRCSAAKERLAWQMQRSAQLADENELLGAQFHVLKDVLTDCIGADGCSIFLPDVDESILTAVASTGTRGDQFRWHDGCWVRSRADTKSCSLSRPCVLQFLYNHPGKAIILNDVKLLERVRKHISEDLPESIATEDLEHLTPDTMSRRFLGLGVRMHGRNWMVIRLTRSKDRPPFTKHDAKLLESMAALCQRYEFWIPAEFAKSQPAGKGGALLQRPARPPAVPETAIAPRCNKPSFSISVEEEEEMLGYGQEVS